MTEEHGGEAVQPESGAPAVEGASGAAPESGDRVPALRHKLHNTMYSVLLQADCALMDLEEGNTGELAGRLLKIKEAAGNARRQIDRLADSISSRERE